MVGGRGARTQPWRLPVLLTGILFATGLRTVTSWLRAVGVSDDFRDYYYFLAPLARKAGSVATQLFLLLLRTLPLPDRLPVVIDDSPTKRYGSKVEGADIHRYPTPGTADQKYLYWTPAADLDRSPEPFEAITPIRFIADNRLSPLARSRGTSRDRGPPKTQSVRVCPSPYPTEQLPYQHGLITIQASR